MVWSYLPSYHKSVKLVFIGLSAWSMCDDSSDQGFDYPGQGNNVKDNKKTVMSYIVYVHTNKINNKKYVGITTKDPKIRWLSNGNGYVKQKHFYSSIQKYGWDNFDHQIIDVQTKEEMFYLEKYLIAFYNTTNKDYGYNKSIGGETGGNYGKNSGTKEYFKQRAKEYYEKHKDEIKERSRQYRLDHIDEYIEYMKDYRNTHKEERAKVHKEYYEKHKENWNIKKS